MTCWASQADADHAASEAEADKRAEFVERFYDDAADEALMEGSAAELLYFDDNNDLHDVLMAALFCNDERGALGKIIALREALRAAAWGKYADSLKVDARRLADAHLADLAEEVAA